MIKNNRATNSAINGNTKIIKIKPIHTFKRIGAFRTVKVQFQDSKAETPPHKTANIIFTKNIRESKLELFFEE